MGLSACQRQPMDFPFQVLPSSVQPHSFIDCYSGLGCGRYRGGHVNLHATTVLRRCFCESRSFSQTHFLRLLAPRSALRLGLFSLSYAVIVADPWVLLPSIETSPANAPDPLVVSVIYVLNAHRLLRVFQAQDFLSGPGLRSPDRPEEKDQEPGAPAFVLCSPRLERLRVERSGVPAARTELHPGAAEARRSGKTKPRPTDGHIAIERHEDEHEDLHAPKEVGCKTCVMHSL
ncbi:hypothetical protein GW7_08705 [Heterocephalus glaber]|uniref:Uncharacterized protein n=1 Tax=Heterocephalus glaber TaxID=10181 RepID=G5AZC5_HETGA|nr:hypothetical protein GW7_08705 [Heterocephalus glaber]